MSWTAARLAVRRLIHAPLFTLVTLVTLAVGIGANTAMFSVVYGVLLKPLPFAEPDRLISLWHIAPGMNIQRLNMSPSTYFTYKDLSRTFQSVGTRILPTLLRRFSDAHPDVEVVLQESSDERELLDLVERGELDLTFWTLPVSAGPYESVELLRDPYVLVVPADSPLAQLKRAPTLKEIVLQPLVGFNRCSAMDEVESRLAASGRTPNIVFRSDNNGTVQGLVGAGVGVSVSPLLTVDEDDPEIRAIDLQDRIPPRVIGLVWHADRHRSRAAE